MLILIVVAAIAIGMAVWIYIRKKRTRELRFMFGPEYDRAIDIHGNRLHAESDLERRAKRVAQFHIRPLKDDERARYAEEWRIGQSLFVDDPRTAVRHADILVQDVMKLRGYPVSDFEQNAADLSVDTRSAHPATGGTSPERKSVIANSCIAGKTRLLKRSCSTAAGGSTLRRSRLSRGVSKMDGGPREAGGRIP